MQILKLAFHKPAYVRTCPWMDRAGECMCVLLMDGSIARKGSCFAPGRNTRTRLPGSRGGVLARVARDGFRG
jgi:hypothetical protein